MQKPEVFEGDEIGSGQFFPVTCAWCLADGRRRVLRYNSRTGGHGICFDHYQELLAEAKGRRHRSRVGVASGT